MTDLELMMQAAKAAGLEVRRGKGWQDDKLFRDVADCDGVVTGVEWNPLTDDGDALRLAVKLRMTLRVEDYGASARIEGKQHGAWNGCEAHLHGGIEAATRRAIVQCAAQIGGAA